ncbi:HlyD family type I secretion periplasmic adaptor subunit [Ruegeria arenilitoris]|uniref:HlyD family type I secretion periplasmic adaptor subunit n=1 Tax=Ruegeria arenilitoris TaxID=1173585 RepID=UPI00147D5756|nr:HlyD family type I secretion periplasmic adaptor subunit [Ruegeria arenilitoris]
MNWEDLGLNSWSLGNIDWSRLHPRNIDFSGISTETFPNGQGAWTLSEQGRSFIAIFVALLLFLALWRIIRRRRRGASEKALSSATRRTRTAGYIIILIFFGGFGTWSAVATLQSAALAPGVISPDGSRKTVQHLEGGIIRQIHVREGDTVAAGSPLVTLQNTSALARYEELQERLVYLLAVEARLEAEQLGSDNIVFSDELLFFPSEAADAARKGQEALFKNALEVQLARERILQQRIAQLEEEIIGLEDVITAQNEQLDLIGSEISTAEELMAKGLQRMPQLLALQREAAQIRGLKASNRASIARNRQQISETELQLLATRQQVKEQAASLIAEVRAELATIRTQLPERRDALERTLVSAPISGRVMNVQVTTEIGGVVRPGEPILELVPDNAALIVDVRVRPQDVDAVVPGMRARVVLTAFNQRFLPQVHGQVRSISADRLTDDRTGEPYFLAKVEVDQSEIEAIGQEIELIAGMPAEVMILTGEQTLFDLMARPITESLRRSFRDNG